MKKHAPFFLLLVSACLWGEMSFSSGVINQRDEVLFAVDTSIPAMPGYRTLFKKDLRTGAIEQLTFFPEEMELLSGGTVLQIRNRFGTVRYNSLTRQFTTIDAFPAVSLGLEPNPGMLEKAGTSPDGKWIASVVPTSPSRGKIVLSDAEGKASIELSASASRGELPVSWSPDSSTIIYEDSGSLYYARPDALFSGSSLPKEYRLIGKGTVNSLCWFDGSRFLYANGTSVYRISVQELSGYSIYRALVLPGELAGRLPVPFNAEEDCIRASPDGKSLLFVEGTKCAYLLPLAGDDYLTGSGSAPLLLLPGNTVEVFPCWTRAGNPAVFARTIEGGKSSLKGWGLSTLSAFSAFRAISVPQDAFDVSISPDGNYAAFIGAGGGIAVYAIATWTKAAEYSSSALCAVWIDSSSMFIGGSGTVSRWNFKSGASEMITVSSVSGFNWDWQGTTPVAFVGSSAGNDASSSSARFRYTGKMKWELAAGTRAGAPVTANPRYRLYIDSFDGAYDNMLYVRDAEGAGGTVPIVSVPSPHDTPLAAGTGGGQWSAKAIEKSAVALVFDALDDTTGLPLVIDALNDYGFKATFFLNGEFIRRHPEAASEIAMAGHQSASMFFTAWDLSDSDFAIDSGFIRRGLARNEDDFHAATGAELSLYWHAPYYIASPEILEGGALAGYEYVQADIAVADWITRENADTLPSLYKSADALIEEIIEKIEPGYVIPVRIGKGNGGSRDDYLYSKIRVLLNALSERGLTVVPVDRL